MKQYGSIKVVRFHLLQSLSCNNYKEFQNVSDREKVKYASMGK